MFEINQDSRMDIKERILFNILKNLEQINKKLDKSQENLIKIPETILEETKEPEKPQGYKCKHCGEFHEKAIQIVNCGKKLNKKG